MFATLGGLLKDYRLKKNISQLEISFAVGWKEPSRLSRIEQGHTGKPKRKLMDKIMDAMRLTEEERGVLLLTGGYLPEDAELKKARKNIQSLVDDWEYPAYALDFSGRLVVWNTQAAKLYSISSKSSTRYGTSTPNMLEILFDTRFPQNKHLRSKKERARWHDTLLARLVKLRVKNKPFAKEQWYKALVAQLMSNAIFKDIWKKSNDIDQLKEIAQYERAVFVDPSDTYERLDFHIMRSPFIPDRRFEIYYHIPADVKTLKAYSS